MSKSKYIRKKDSDLKKDTIQPKTTIQVHKEYDENGNLIRLDSTYTYFYSNIKNDSILERDIYKKFKLGFDKELTPLDSVFKTIF